MFFYWPASIVQGSFSTLPRFFSHVEVAPSFCARSLFPAQPCGLKPYSQRSSTGTLLSKLLGLSLGAVVLRVSEPVPFVSSLC